jgi:hypothetical protein
MLSTHLFQYSKLKKKSATAIVYYDGILKTNIGYLKEGMSFTYVVMNFSKMALKICINNVIYVTNFSLNTMEFMYEKYDDSDVSGEDESSEEESGEDESSEDESGEDESSEDESGEDESGEDESSEDESGEDESGESD